MAYADLVLKLGTLTEGLYKETYNVAGDEATVEDSTGVYDVADNPGGYGAPNPERNTLGLVALIDYKATAGDETVVPTAFDGLLVTEILIPITKDGHIQVDGWLLPIIVGGEPEDTFAYDGADGLPKKLVSAVWVEVTDLNDLFADATLIHDVLHMEVLVATSKKRNDINKERFDKIITGEYNETRDALDRQYINVDGRFDQASYQFAAGNYYNFQRIVEGINQYIAQYGI